mmetsp:Transcript_36777/g.89524  ORF Transcript_36777/g.89524 Transcript_36777/m.89524 type:complete len:204 (-) Transcript_36777:949-1560(-)
MVAWQEEEERRARLLTAVRQAAADDSIPLLERTCAICMDTLGTAEHGPVVQLDCHTSHCFHTECIARAWDGRPTRLCPCCRRQPSLLDVSLASFQQWRLARRADDERVAREWDAQAAWRDANLGSTTGCGTSRRGLLLRVPVALTWPCSKSARSSRMLEVACTSHSRFAACVFPVAWVGAGCALVASWRTLLSQHASLRPCRG